MSTVFQKTDIFLLLSKPKELEKWCLSVMHSWTSKGKRYGLKQPLYYKAKCSGVAVTLLSHAAPHRVEGHYCAAISNIISASDSSAGGNCAISAV